MCEPYGQLNGLNSRHYCADRCWRRRTCSQMRATRGCTWVPVSSRHRRAAADDRVAALTGWSAAIAPLGCCAAAVRTD